MHFQSFFDQKGFNIVLDLGANIQCDEKDMLDFSIMGASLYKSLFPTDDAKVALLNIGSEEMKGNDIVKNSYQLITKHNQKLFWQIGLKISLFKIGLLIFHCLLPDAFRPSSNRLSSSTGSGVKKLP